MGGPGVRCVGVSPESISCQMQFSPHWQEHGGGYGHEFYIAILYYRGGTGAKWVIIYKSAQTDKLNAPRRFWLHRWLLADCGLEDRWGTRFSPLWLHLNTQGWAIIHNGGKHLAACNFDLNPMFEREQLRCGYRGWLGALLQIYCRYKKVRILAVLDMQRVTK